MQEIEMMLDEERRASDEGRHAVAIIDRKRATLQAELDDARALLEAVSVNSFVRPSTGRSSVT